MNILLVDDKCDVVYGIAAGIDWTAVGDVRLFFAFSGKEALEIMEKNRIQLLITDIEMPGMSGLELAAALQERGGDTGVVFLSSHDSFRYAQAAIRLGCYDYILQPVEYERLQDSIIHVINQMLLKKTEASDSEENRRREDGALRKEQAWREILLHWPAYDSGLMQDILEDAQVYLRKDCSYRLIVATLFWRKETLHNWITHRMENELIRELRGALPEGTGLAAAFMTADRRCVMILEDSDVIPALEEFLSTRHSENDSTVAVYVSRPEVFSRLPGVYQNLSRLIEENVGQYGGIFECRGSEKCLQEELAVSDMPAVQNWKEWLLDGQENLIREDIVGFLQKKDAAKKLDKRTLVVIAQLIADTVCSSEKMMTEARILDHFVRATDSAANLLAFFDEAVLRYKQKMAIALEGDSIALLKQIQNYVGSHLENALSREEIAEKFFISKDYLSHLFSGNVGMGFTQYVNEQRMSKAKELLRNTNLPIKIIALNVGMADYAYFSRLFRKSTGISANEYRLSRRKDK